MIDQPIKCASKLDIHLQKNEFNLCLQSCTNINSKFIKGLNLKPEMLKLLSEHIRNNLQDIAADAKNFLNRTPARAGTSPMYPQMGPYRNKNLPSKGK